MRFLGDAGATTRIGIDVGEPCGDRIRAFAVEPESRLFPKAVAALRLELAPLKNKGYTAGGIDRALVLNMLRCHMGKTDDLRDSHSTFLALSTPFVASGITLAYFANPLFEYADTTFLFLSGANLALAIGFFTLFFITEDKRSSRSHFRAAIAFGLCGFIGLVIVFGFAMVASQRNDYQCGLLEQDMMSIRHNRTDSVDLYRALGCHQQSAGTLTFRGPGKTK